MRDNSPSRFRAAMRKQFDQFYPGHTGAVIKIKWRGVTLRADIPPCERGRKRPSLSTMQRSILEVLRKRTDPISGDELAKQAGYRPGGGAWKKALAGLIHLGTVESGLPGYGLKKTID